MKKISLLLSMFILAASAHLMAQSAGKVQLQDFHIKMNDGKNIVRVPDGKGTIQLNKRGDRFTDVVYTDAAGKSTRLVPAQPGTGGAPKPACKFPIPDACYSIPNSQEIGMCICRPTDLSSGEYTVSLLLPAVQAARESARRTSTNNN